MTRVTNLYGLAARCKLNVIDLELARLTHLYLPFEWSAFLPAIMDIRRHPGLIRVKAILLRLNFTAGGF